MTIKKLQQRYLTCNEDESIEKKIEKAAKGAKIKVRTNKGSEFGSGMHSSKNGSNMLNMNCHKIKRELILSSLFTST